MPLHLDKIYILYRFWCFMITIITHPTISIGRLIVASSVRNAFNIFILHLHSVSGWFHEWHPSFAHHFRILRMDIEESTCANKHFNSIKDSTPSDHNRHTTFDWCGGFSGRFYFILNFHEWIEWFDQLIWK